MSRVSVLSVLVVLAFWSVVEASGAALDEERDDRQVVESRKKHLYRHALYAALPWLFALKIKIIIVTVAVTLLFFKLFVPFGFATGYSSAPVYESWGKSDIEERPPDWSDEHTKSRQLVTDLTERVMQGLAAAELSWRAVIEEDGSSGSCRARLICELRREAKNNSLAAGMVALLGSSLDTVDKESTTPTEAPAEEDCTNLKCELSSAVNRPASGATQDSQPNSTTGQP